jgi:hypothetical protein
LTSAWPPITGRSWRSSSATGPDILPWEGANDRVEGEVPASALIVGGIVSMGVGLSALWPARGASRFDSDGARLLRLSRDTADTDREVAILAILAQSMAGVRPREFDPTLVSRSIGVEDGSRSAVTGRMITASHDLDAGRIEQARGHLTRVLDQLDALPPGARGGFVLEAAFVAAFHDNDPSRARALLDSARDDLLTVRAQRPLAVAAIAIASHDADGARVALDEARRALPDIFDAGHRVVTADRIAMMHARIEPPG